MHKMKIPVLDFTAKLAVQGLLLFNTPALFSRLYNMGWYGGVLNQWVDELELKPTSDVLEIGCGPGGLCQHIADNGNNVTGADRSLAMVDHAKKVYGQNAKFLQADALRLPFEDDSFDTVVAASLVNVVDDKQSLIREMARVVRPHGCISLFFPTQQFDQRAADQFALENNLGSFESAAMAIWAKKAHKLEPEIVEQLLADAGTKPGKRRYFSGENLVAVSAQKNPAY